MGLSIEEKKQLKKLLVILGAVAILLCLILTLFFRTPTVTRVVKRAFSILEPFIWGFAIAYLLRPACNYIEKGLVILEKKVSKKHRPGLIRTVSIVFSLIFLLAIVVLLLLAVLPELITSISSLIGQLPAAFTNFRDWIVTLDHGGTSH